MAPPWLRRHVGRGARAGTSCGGRSRRSLLPPLTAARLRQDHDPSAAQRRFSLAAGYKSAQWPERSSHTVKSGREPPEFF
ncbi:hypothetical protein VPH35_003408 [Triticum aestivum]